MLARRSFLRFWCFSNVYTDEGKRSESQTGKELADLVVVFDNKVIIFSDKHCEYPSHQDSNVAWDRWYRKAIDKSVRQLLGAEKWLREHSKRLFLDSRCTISLPEFASIEPNTEIHLVAVTRGSAAACVKFFGGDCSPTYMIDSRIRGREHAKHPFQVGVPAENGRFVHVFDETSLDLLMEELDTVSDFTRYLRSRSEFLRDEMAIVAPGEEELLALYLENIEDDEHCFPDFTQYRANGFVVEAGRWADIVSSERWRNADNVYRVSYKWDALIEYLSEQLGRKEIDGPRQSPITNIEQCVRVMAAENRFQRRLLSETALEVFSRVIPPGSRFLRVRYPNKDTDTTYVFVSFEGHPGQADREYRRARISFLEAACMAVKRRRPSTTTILGLACQSATSRYSSYDVAAMLFDSQPLSEEESAVVIEKEEQWRLFKSYEEKEVISQELPDLPESLASSKPTPAAQYRHNQRRRRKSR